jgi:hypothetical protein
MLSRPKLHRLWTTLAFSISGKSPCSFWKRHYEVLFTWLGGLACAVSTCIAYAERLLAASVQDLANKRLDLVNRWKKDGANRECFKLVDLAEFLSQDRTIRHCNSSSDPSRTRKIQAVDLLSIGVTGFSGRCTFTAKSPDGTTSISDHRGLKPFSQSKSTTSVEATLFYDTPLLRRLGSEWLAGASVSCMGVQSWAL